MGFNLTSEQIKDTYGQLVQISGSTLVNGLGNTFNVLVPSSSHSAYAVNALSASYAISASYEIIKEVSSSYADTASFADFATTATSASYALTASFATVNLQQVTDNGSSTDNDILLTNPNGNQTLTFTGSIGNVILRGHPDFGTTFAESGLFGVDKVSTSILKLDSTDTGGGNYDKSITFINNRLEMKGAIGGVYIYGNGTDAATSEIRFIPKNTFVVSFKDASVQFAAPITASSTISASGGFIGDLTGTASFAVSASYAPSTPGGLVSGTGPNSLASSLTTTPAVALGTGSIAIGDGAEAGWGTIAINNGNIAIGRNAIASGSVTGGGISIGDGSKTKSQNSIALGKNAAAFHPSTTVIASVAIGAESEASSSSQVVIGYNARSFGNSTGTIVIGANANTIDDNRSGTVVIGYNAQSYQNAVAIGESSFGIESSVAIGKEARTNDNQSVAIGRLADTSSPRSVAIGYNVNSDQVDQIVIGANASATTNANEGIVIGSSAQIDFLNNIAIGYDAVASSNPFAVGLGAYTNASGQYSTALGHGAAASASGSVALGSNVTAATANTTTTKRLQLVDYASFDFPNDTAAAAGGIPLGGIYHDTGSLRIRIV